MENEELEYELTVDILDEKVRNAKNGEEAEYYARAYKEVTEADLMEYERQEEFAVEREKLEVEKAKIKTEKRKTLFTLIGTGLVALGTAGAAVIKVLGDLKYQENCQQYEDEGAYTNYKKHHR